VSVRERLAGTGVSRNGAPRGAGRLLVIGGSSEIAGAIAAELVHDGVRDAVLAGRDAGALFASAGALRAAGAERVQTVELDALDTAGHRPALERAFAMLGEVDVAVLAVGVLGSRGGLPQDIPAAVEVLSVNTVGAGSLLMETARLMRAQGHGTIVVLSSVAAERPRASNAVYCASKAGLDALARALDDELSDAGVRVMVVRPGFVRTRMTAGLPAPPLATNAPAVARATASGLRRRSRTVWSPGALRWVMAGLRMLPRAVFKRLPA
jgi:decaprenylphospho-beta-D-erythro-pentofuranosid-2-ulose 2-reductase